MDNRRLMIAALLSVMIVMVWQYFFPPVPPADLEPPPAVEAANEEAGTEAGEPTESPASPGAAPAGASGTGLEDPEGDPGAATAEVAAPPPMEEIVAEREEIIEVDVPRARAIFTNRGAQLTSYLLKQHENREGTSLDLVRSRGKDLYPFSIVYSDRGSRLNTALFEWEKRQTENGEVELVFRHSSEAGWAEKVFSWNEAGFMQVRAHVKGEPGWGLVLGPGVNNEATRSNYGQTVSRGVGYRRAGEIEILEADDQEEDTVISSVGLDWVTLEDNFFLMAMIPESGVADVLVRPVLQREETDASKPRFLPIDTSSREEDLSNEQMLILRPSGERAELTAYIGAKRYSFLSKQPYGLEDTVRWGTYIGLLAKPLYITLEWIYTNLVANYGFAIVLTTLLLRLLFFPLTHKSQKSMSKMQELNPKVQAIRSKYRPKLRDKQGRPNIEAQQQMNEEVMAVYRGAGVNPASGCLPILLQMPVFFAFFRLLTTAVELRGAGWLAWIHDLSQPDPYYLLPLLMGATSVAMQKMMPASPDPMQRRIMQMMPIVFTAFAFAFPSGLVLYWLTNNILTMAQQALINRMNKKEEAAS
ncbi:MAG: membrane protein insertase YidC [Holophagales bacterium]|nr:membrane protein insertase YidC [Holophagales bacterium]